MTEINKTIKINGETKGVTQEPKTFTATEYFEYVKAHKNEVTKKEIEEFRENAVYLLEKYKKTGQVAGMKKLLFLAGNIEKVYGALDKGVNQYVLTEDLKKFISMVDSKVVKIIELENYPREIPDEIVEKFEMVKDDFDKFYVLFTDYTGEVERQVEQSRKDKDPILFGTFYNEDLRKLSERFYYIGDWEDEYCDLTLEKLVFEMEKAGEGNPVKTEKSLNKLEDIRKEMESYEYVRGAYVKRTQPVKKGFFAKVKTFLSGNR